jgi:N-acetylmuramoyl-L-alanine amidase
MQAGRAVSPLAVSPRPLVGHWPRTLPVYGVLVHTTSRSPAVQGRATRQPPIKVALDTYFNARDGIGPHYVIGYDGTIYAVCDENHIAWHAGWGKAGKQRWVSWAAPAWWSTVWSKWHAATPAGLLPPGTSDPNQVYIGVELLADETGYGFTSAQYDALARLVLDVARRHRFTISAAPSPRLLGHEDTDPINRGQAAGGWDPGAHRRDPKFSWAGLWSRMQGLCGSAGQPTGTLAPQPAPAAPGIVLPFGDLLRDLFGAGGAPITSFLGAAEAMAAYAAGERNANRLTDILFRARHPERAGRPIAAGETQAANEWVWIRDNVVQPALWRATAALATAGQALPVAAPVGTPSASHFRKMQPRDPNRYRLLAQMLDRYRGEIPLKFLLGWVAVESDGCIDVITKPPLDERGFFQISREESRMRKFDHERLTTDPDYSVQAGIQLIRSYAKLAQARYPWATPGSELFWRLVKLQHAMGSPLAWKLLSSMQRSNTPMTWEAIKRYEVTDGPWLHSLLNPRNPAERGRFGRNVDNVFVQGQRIAATLRK